MMNQNAVQVLGIIKAAYGEAIFDHNRYDENCAQPNSEAEVLLCDWREVEISQGKEKLKSMTKVCIEVPTCL